MRRCALFPKSLQNHHLRDRIVLVDDALFMHLHLALSTIWRASFPLLVALILTLACFRLLAAAVKVVCSIYSAAHGVATSPLSSCLNVRFLGILASPVNFPHILKHSSFMSFIQVDSNANHTYRGSATTSSILGFRTSGWQACHAVDSHIRQPASIHN